MLSRSRRALALATPTRQGWRFVSVQSPPPDDGSRVLEKMLGRVLEKLDGLEQRSDKPAVFDGAGDYVLKRLSLVDSQMAKLTEKMEDRDRQMAEKMEDRERQMAEKMEDRDSQMAELKKQMEVQTRYHMEWCQRDLSVVAAEILKWSIGARGSSGGDGRQLYTTTNQGDVMVGARVFRRELEDFKDFSRSVILERNHQVHFGSLKMLDERVESAQRYIHDFGIYLRVSRPAAVEIVENYAALKESLPERFQ